MSDKAAKVAAAEAPSPAKPPTDIGIITIREDEFRAALHFFPASEIESGAREYNICNFDTMSGAQYRIAVVRCVHQGTGEAQEVTRDLIEDLNPRWIIVLGIGGGVPSDDFSLGDVVVSTRIQDFSVEAVLSGGDREFSLAGGPVDRKIGAIIANIPAIENRLANWNAESNIGMPRPTVAFQDPKNYTASDQRWNDRLRKSLESAYGQPRAPLVITGEVASSDRLVKDVELLKVWQRAARQILAIEMESAGVYRAARDKVPALAIRGISDIVGFQRADDMIKYACRTAAAFCAAFLHSGPLQKPPKIVISDPASLDPAPSPPDPLASAFLLACRNIAHHGDTDIFPYPPENLALRDCEKLAVELLVQLNDDFSASFASIRPTHHSALTQLGYTGFRWATQLDPLWNAYFLGLVIAVGPDIERSRIPVQSNVVFSYRFAPDVTTSAVFKQDGGWLAFQRRSLELAQKNEYALKCDIADFYQRVSHEHLQQALAACTTNVDVPWRIRRILEDFSVGSSVGLPVGGPAARLLSELVLSRLDLLLYESGVPFCRYSDDFHLFADSSAQAYERLVFLTEHLQRDLGLTLQKLKTRLMRSAEFSRSLEALVATDEPANADALDAGAFLKMRLRFDPYSPTAIEDYERLASAVKRFDILGLLSRELAKGRIHDALVRRLLQAIRFLDSSTRNATVATLLENLPALTPVLSTVLIVLRQLFAELSEAVQDRTVTVLCNAIEGGIPPFRLDTALCYAFRVLAEKETPRSQKLLVGLFDSSHSPLVRRDIILVEALWKKNHWLSSIKQQHRQLAPWERRSLILASFILGDEGATWRQQRLGEIDPTEKLLVAWAAKTDLVKHGFGLR